MEYTFAYHKCQSCTERINCDRCAEKLTEELLLEAVLEEHGIFV